MKKAFLFDMDGVILDSEKQWHNHGQEFLKNLYGEEIFSKMKDITGMSLDGEYALAKTHGFDMNIQEFIRRYDEAAQDIYAKSTITKGLEELIDKLKSLEFVVGIVSSSRRPWIEMALAKVKRKDLFDYILSLNEASIPSKPSPHGYIKAMQDLDTSPSTTFILEDSNSGITAGKEAGAFVIAFTPLLVNGYQQKKADALAHSFEDVLEIVSKK